MAPAERTFSRHSAVEIAKSQNGDRVVPPKSQRKLGFHHKEGVNSEATVRTMTRRMNCAKNVECAGRSLLQFMDCFRVMTPLFASTPIGSSGRSQSARWQLTCSSTIDDSIHHMFVPAADFPGLRIASPDGGVTTDGEPG